MARAKFFRYTFENKAFTFLSGSMQSSKWLLSRVFRNSRKFNIHIPFKIFIDFLVIFVKFKYLL